MKVQLLVSEWCPSCHQAEAVWQQVSQEKDIEFSVVDMGQPEGRELVSQLRLKTVPSIVIDGDLKAVGVQTKQEALELVAEAPDREADESVRHVGISMELSTRVQVLSAVVYLVISGTSLVFHQGLFAEGAGRVAPLHVYTLGFITFLIYGLGEHMLPRFTERPIRLGASAWGQIIQAHAGLLGLVVALTLGWPGLALAGGIGAWLALLVFSIRLWPVLWPMAE